MSDHPHLSLGGTDTAWTWACRCGATPTEYTAETARGPWGRDCPAAMRDEIVALRVQVEALKEGAGSLHKAYARGRAAGVRAGLAVAVRTCTLVEVAHRAQGGLLTSCVGDRECALTISEINPDEVEDV